MHRAPTPEQQAGLPDIVESSIACLGDTAQPSVKWITEQILVLQGNPNRMSSQHNRGTLEPRTQAKSEFPNRFGGESGSTTGSRIRGAFNAMSAVDYPQRRIQSLSISLATCHLSGACAL
jgi:hypothetical protein